MYKSHTKSHSQVFEIINGKTLSDLYNYSIQIQKWKGNYCHYNKNQGVFNSQITSGLHGNFVHVMYVSMQCYFPKNHTS